MPQLYEKNSLFIRFKCKDEKLAKTFGKGHFRRNMDYEANVTKIERLNFKVLEKVES
jgi:hypothetical protein